MGNAKSGAGIPFRMGYKEMEQKMEAFRQEYGDGSRGMVTWERWCAYIGYSMEVVRACYQRGKSGDNAYTARANLLERWYTEVRAMMLETCRGQMTVAKDQARTNHLLPEAKAGGGGVVTVQFAGSAEEAKRFAE